MSRTNCFPSKCPHLGASHSPPQIAFPFSVLFPFTILSNAIINKLVDTFFGSAAWKLSSSQITYFIFNGFMAIQTEMKSCTESMHVSITSVSCSSARVCEYERLVSPMVLLLSQHYGLSCLQFLFFIAALSHRFRVSFFSLAFLALLVSLLGLLFVCYLTSFFQMIFWMQNNWINSLLQLKTHTLALHRNGQRFFT